jgi:hypothetical protein
MRFPMWEWLYYERISVKRHHNIEQQQIMNEAEFAERMTERELHVSVV